MLDNYLCMENQTELLLGQIVYQGHSAEVQHQQRRGTLEECSHHQFHHQTLQTLERFWQKFLECCPALYHQWHQEPPIYGPETKEILLISGHKHLSELCTLLLLQETCFPFVEQKTRTMQQHTRIKEIIHF